jgi:hypothetical protein
MAVNILIGNPITVTVHITAPSGPALLATGVAVLQDNGITIGTQEIIPLPLVGPNVSGTVFTLDSTTLGIGLHDLVVYYAGDGNFPATSFTSSELQKNIVYQVNTVSALTPSSFIVNVGQSTTLTFTISASSSITDPTAQIQLYINDVATGAPISTTPTPSGGTAGVMLSSEFTLGTNTVYGIFSSGSEVYGTSTSNTIIIVYS